MLALQNKILSFNNWSQPWTFHEFVSGDKTLPETDLHVFNEIWTKAGDAEFWNNADLILCCKASQLFITQNYDLTERAVANIVRALAYQWK